MKKIPTSTEEVSLLEWKFLANSILNTKANIRMQCVEAGKSWTGKFHRIMMVTEKGLILNDETSDKMKSINFLDRAIQFAIDQPYDNFNSNMGYRVL